MTGYDKAKETADKLKENRETEEKAVDTQVKSSIEALHANKDLAQMYQGSVNVGTKEVTQEDLETPTLKLISKNPELIELADKGEMNVGWYYRKDLGIQMETIDVNLVCLKKSYAEYDGKVSRQYLFYGVYADGGTDVFRMYVSGGWNLGGARTFNAEVARIKKDHGLPMYPLKVRLSSVIQKGTFPHKSTGQPIPYVTYQFVAKVLKDENGNPQLEQDMGRGDFLREIAERFDAEKVKDDVPTQNTGNQSARDAQEILNAPPRDAKLDKDGNPLPF